MHHFFIGEIGSKVFQLLPSSIVLKMLCKCLTPRQQRELILKRFNLGRFLSSLPVKTGTVNETLIINSTFFQLLLLGAVKILRHVTRYKTLARERVFFTYYYHCSKISGLDTFISALFDGIRNCTHMEKLDILYSMFFSSFQVMTQNE